MNTITIDTNIYKSVESFARRTNTSIREFVEKALIAAMPHTENVSQQDMWRRYKISPEVMEMTFEERKDIPEDYDSELQNGIAEKYL